MKLNILVALLLAPLSLVGCIGYAHLPKPQDLLSHTKGADVEVLDTNEDYLFDGELLAVQGDTLYVMSFHADSALLSAAGLRLLVPNTWIGAIPTSLISLVDVRVSRTANSPTTTAVWFSGLTLLTASHGWNIILTLPFALIYGLPTVFNATTAAFHVEAPESELRKFARFPQGLPQGVELSKIQ